MWPLLNRYIDKLFCIKIAGKDVFLAQSSITHSHKSMFLGGQDNCNNSNKLPNDGLQENETGIYRIGIAMQIYKSRDSLYKQSAVSLLNVSIY